MVCLYFFFFLLLPFLLRLFAWLLCTYERCVLCWNIVGKNNIRCGKDIVAVVSISYNVLCLPWPWPICGLPTTCPCSCRGYWGCVSIAHSRAHTHTTHRSGKNDKRKIHFSAYDGAIAHIWSEIEPFNLLFKYEILSQLPGLYVAVDVNVCTACLPCSHFRTIPIHNIQLYISSYRISH